MSVGMSLLALLGEGPSYGLRLKKDFEARTGGVWPLNVGQIYTTLDRLERDGFVREISPRADDVQKVHEITDAGSDRVRAWFEHADVGDRPARDEVVLKLIMAAGHAGVDAAAVIQTERRGAVELLREFTRLKQDPKGDDLGWSFLVDSLIFKTEARVRWLDACEARLASSDHSLGTVPSPSSENVTTADDSSEALR